MSTDEPRAWAITTLFTKDGIGLDLKASGGDMVAAIEDLYAGIEYAIENYGATTELGYAPKSSERLEEVNIPDGLEMNESFAVKSIAKCVTDGGKEFLKVKGGTYTKYGLKAWPEVWPDGADFSEWIIGKEYSPPKQMARVYTDKQEGAEGFAKKVLMFTE